MTDSYSLTQLDSFSFENMVNAIAMRVLGVGHTGFGPGPDGGRDGLYIGEAPYPSAANCWKGIWYIQSKFHKPHLSKDEQKWLIAQIKKEIALFNNPLKKRKWPDIWILATNIEPSGLSQTGAFDKARELVAKARPILKNRFHIWGGHKIIEYLNMYMEVAQRYGHFLTPGYVISTLYDQLKEDRASLEDIIQYLVSEGLEENQHTKLEQAGSSMDMRPGLQHLFVDLPFISTERTGQQYVLQSLCKTASENHIVDSSELITKSWKRWRRYPSRARVWVIKGSPGCGKTTIGQYICQLHRSAIILQDEIRVQPDTYKLAEEIKKTVSVADYWPISPRIPLFIELKEYAQWFGSRGVDDQRGVLTYLAHDLTRNIEKPVTTGILEKAFKVHSWIITLDGLDEVPSDIKDSVASEIHKFLRKMTLVSDMLAICTSRPQGYAGQFDRLGGAIIELSPLDQETALKCAEKLICFERSRKESSQGMEILENAIKSPAVCELMRSPLQAHIMAVIVRSGQRPPEKRWLLYKHFYKITIDREANKHHVDPQLKIILQQDKNLLSSVHNHLGFVLHARAEKADGANTSISHSDFRNLVSKVVMQHKELCKDGIIDSVMRATTERLVLINTPDRGGMIRFDIRQLQEFFAAGFLYEGVESNELQERLMLLAGDVHWREVIHFLMSALVEENRLIELTLAIDVLLRLDSEGSDGNVSWLSSRFARGAFIAARLLEDGVLEGNKIIRNKFRECLTPIFGIADYNLLGASGFRVGKTTS